MMKKTTLSLPRLTAAAFVSLMVATPFGAADVTARSESSFVSEHQILIAADPLATYEALTVKIAHWWDAAHSYSGQAKNFSIDARGGGCFCEALDNGGSVMHMLVVHAHPGTLLRLTGGLGPLQGMGAGGSMDFALSGVAAGEEEHTQLSYRYVVNGLPNSGIGELADAVDQVQLGQLRRLQRFLSSVN